MCNANFKNPSRTGIRLIKVAVAYLILGLVIGLGMAMSGQFQLRPVHTHINLLGWVSLALTGMVYCLLPTLSETRLAHGHVWLHNLGLPIMMVALGFYHLGYPQFEPLLGIGSLMTASGLLLFGINLLKNIDASKAEIAILERTALTE